METQADVGAGGAVQDVPIPVPPNASARLVPVEMPPPPMVPCSPQRSAVIAVSGLKRPPASGLGDRLSPRGLVMKRFRAEVGSATPPVCPTHEVSARRALSRLPHDANVIPQRHTTMEEKRRRLEAVMAELDEFTRARAEWEANLSSMKFNRPRQTE